MLKKQQEIGSDKTKTNPKSPVHLVTCISSTATGTWRRTPD